MTTFAPASASILAVPSPRPEAPPVTMKVLLLSCMGSPLSLLRALLLLLGHQPRAVAQERSQAVLRDEIVQRSSFFSRSTFSTSFLRRSSNSLSFFALSSAFSPFAGVRVLLGSPATATLT